jgi:carbon-monoxide dehydrogenase medium subunit
VEAALVGNALDEAALTAAAAAVSADWGEDVLGDIHASIQYRQAMAPVYVKRALQKAAERAG